MDTYNLTTVDAAPKVDGYGESGVLRSNADDDANMARLGKKQVLKVSNPLISAGQVSQARSLTMDGSETLGLWPSWASVAPFWLPGKGLLCMLRPPLGRAAN